MDAYLSSFRLRALPSESDVKQPRDRQIADSTTVSDEHLISRLQLKEQDALAELFKRHSTAIYHLGRKILRDPGEADDLVQEVFLYVYRKSELFDSSRGTARSWIFQIAYTQAFLRRRKLKSMGLYRSTFLVDHRAAEPVIDSPAEYDASVKALFGRAVWMRVAEDLTQDQRETLRLHFFEGYTFAETAEKLGQSYANVRNHHYRGLEKLRKHLNEDELNRR